MAKYNQLQNQLFTIILIISSIIGITTLQKSLIDQEEILTVEQIIQKDQETAERLALMKKIPTFGFNNLISSWLFLDFVGYFGNVDQRDVTGYTLTADYYEIITTLDPRYVNSYFNLDPALTLFAGRPDLSVKFMADGLRYIQPEQEWAYQVWLFKGVNELLFLGRIQDAMKSYEKAAEWAIIANTEKSIIFSKVYQRKIEFLKTNPDSRRARYSAWMMLLQNAKDDQTRQFIFQELEKLGAEIKVENGVLSINLPDNID